MRARQNIGVSTAVLVAMAAGGVASGQGADFYQAATGDLHQETVQYVDMLRHLKATGQPAPGAEAFAFSAAWANSPLFDPYLAARRTVSTALASNDPCVTVIDSASVATFMLTGEITSSLLDVEATLSHLAAIQAAGGVSAIATYESLISNGLPLIAPPVGATEPVPGVAAGAELSHWMAAIELHTTGFAGGLIWSPAGPLSGGSGPIIAMADEVWTFSIDVLEAVPDSVVPMHATFGIYGSLPVLAVWRGEHYFLLDAVTGAASGPYHQTTPYNPVELLLQHEVYLEGTPVVVLDQNGCVVTMP